MNDIQKGISFSGYTKDIYMRPEARLSLDKLADTGVKWVAIQVTWFYNKECDDPDVICPDKGATPSDESLESIITYAHSLRLKVMLKPMVDYPGYRYPRRCLGRWQNQICDEVEPFTESQYNDWFQSYEKFITNYAQKATAWGVDLFCIGTELEGTTEKKNEWHEIIAKVRGQYQGPITYAAEAYDKVEWWDKLDYIGVNIYWRKSDWSTYLKELDKLYEDYGKNILITEIGYHSIEGATTEYCCPKPAEIYGRKVNLKEQEDIYNFAIKKLEEKGWLAGIYWWDWSPDPFAGGSCDKGFTPQGKPAENVIRKWYNRDPFQESPMPIPDYGRIEQIYLDGNTDNDWQVWKPNDVDQIDFEKDAPDPDGGSSKVIRVKLKDEGLYTQIYESPRTIDDSQYYWLEFQIRGHIPDAPQEKPHLKIEVEYDDKTEVYRNWVDKCRYIDNAAIELAWKQVSIPLSHLLKSGHKFNSIGLTNDTDGNTFEIWLKDIKLVPKQPS